MDILRKKPLSLSSLAFGPTHASLVSNIGSLFSSHRGLRILKHAKSWSSVVTACISISAAEESMTCIGVSAILTLLQRSCTARELSGGPRFVTYTGYSPNQRKHPSLSASARHAAVAMKRVTCKRQLFDSTDTLFLVLFSQYLESLIPPLQSHPSLSA